jgi:integrase
VPAGGRSPQTPTSFARAPQARGLIDHEYLFFHSGEPIRDLHETYARWRRTLGRLGIRYRKRYAARHTSVSWDLMLGRNPLWVARQHGHSLLTMLRVYAAWTDGGLEVDAEAIRRAMGLAARARGLRSATPQPKSAPKRRSVVLNARAGTALAQPVGLATGLASH